MCPTFLSSRCRFAGRPNSRGRPYMGDSVHCSTHGSQPEAFVCQHILASLNTRRGVGFHWSAEDDGTTPDAWCSDCEHARHEAGDWSDDLMRQVGVALVCASCYRAAKDIWLSARVSG
ncbi:hypothetical protein XFF6166_230002 [Xanthomonas citri pv. fuscans]|nr:hypothetical protein XFF6166_230002 [Xanthomonas citri pv. fuscans]SOO45617.1 hypothetical protein XFF1815_880003 [Xanthomonas citri pv. fuscans]